MCNNSDVYTFSYFLQTGKASAGTVYIVLHVSLQEIFAFIGKIHSTATNMTEIQEAPETRTLSQTGFCTKSMTTFFLHSEILKEEYIVFKLTKARDY